MSFYDWTMEEGIRPDNPARQVRRPKKRPTSVYRLTRAEAAAMLDASLTFQDRAVVHMGLCAGLRNAELRGLTAGDLARPGYVHVPAGIAKGGRPMRCVVCGEWCVCDGCQEDWWRDLVSGVSHGE